MLKVFCMDCGTLSGKERRFELVCRRRKRYAVPAPPCALLDGNQIPSSYNVHDIDDMVALVRSHVGQGTHLF